MLSAGALNRATLERQLLLRRERVPVAEAVRRVVALQAQHPASPYLALLARVDGLDPAAVDEAFLDGTLVKATLLRITLHAVHAEDRHVLRQAMEPTLRAARLERRFRSTGLLPADADVLVPALLRRARTPMTGAEVEAWLAEQVGDRGTPTVARMLRGYAPWLHAPAGGPWLFGPRPSFVAPDGPPVVLADAAVADEALQGLVLRYLSGFGPAGVADVGQFALVPLARVRAAVAALGDRLVHLPGPGGTTLLDLPGATVPEEDVPAPPRLLPMWDSTLLAYADRSRVLPAALRPLVTRSNGDVLPTLLVDGRVVGVWRLLEDRVEAWAFAPVPERDWDGLEHEAARVLSFVRDREPDVYRRYGHWWPRLPEPSQVRLLGR